MNLLVNNIAPAYRKGIWEKLSIDLNFSFAFDSKEYKGIKTISKEEFSFFSSNCIFYELNSFLVKKVMIWQRGLIRLILKYDFKTVVLLGYPYCINYWLAILLLRFKGVNIVLWTHGIYGNELYPKYLFKIIFFKLADKILVYNQRGKDLLIEGGIDSDKIEIIYNSLAYSDNFSLNSDPIQVFNKYNLIYNGYKNVVFIGRLTNDKKLDLLLSAKKYLSDNYLLEFNLIIIGTGDYKEDLENLCDREKISDVFFLGGIYKEEDIGNLINISNVSVSPGSIGLMAMHSLFYGTPVITHNNFNNQWPEFEAITDNLTGSFFKEDDIYDLAIKMRKWIIIEKTMEVQLRCKSVILEKYNSSFQLQVMKRIIK